MKAKMNRYDLSLWDVRKLQLYGSATLSVQAATLFSAKRSGHRYSDATHIAIWLLHGDGLANSTSTKTE